MSDPQKKEQHKYVGRLVFALITLISAMFFFNKYMDWDKGKITKDEFVYWMLGGICVYLFILAVSIISMILGRTMQQEPLPDAKEGWDEGKDDI